MGSGRTDGGCGKRPVPRGSDSEGHAVWRRVSNMLVGRSPESLDPSAECLDHLLQLDLHVVYQLF